MATAPTKTAKTTQSGQSAKVKSYVNQQLEKTRRQVKTNELISGVLTLIAFSLAFLLLTAIWDAWVSPLSIVGRWVCLAILIGSCLVYVGLVLIPLTLKKINPDYAAKMIEDAKPSFKNSLLNYVSLRRKNKSVNPAVFDAVSRQAATDLASVPGDATVDRSKLIRLGFVLIGLMVFAVGYKMLSPKDPLQTFGRIFSPGAKIAQPAVVRISDVLPGDTRVFFGDQVDVTAVVRGRHAPEDVQIQYSTVDGQLTDQTVTMVPDEVANRYRAKLSIDGNGIQQSLTYRVIARDGSSPDFQIVVQPNPTIAVETLILTPPEYTKLPTRTFSGQGAVEAIEGTKVTVNAIANQPIKMAYIELLNEIPSQTPAEGQTVPDSRYQTARSIEMKSDGKTATVDFVALLDASRKKQNSTHYRIKFVSETDDRNLTPNVYPIRITPDLAPEVIIFNPQEQDIQVPANGSVAIEIEANDLDFEISSVALHLDHQGSKLLDTNLKMISRNGNQRVNARYLLRPEELRLKEGDKAMFFASAEDNRVSSQSGQPDPNVSRTDNFTLTITAAQQNPDPSDKQPQNDNQKQDRPQEGDSQNDDPAEKNDSQESESDKSESDKSESDKSESDKSESDKSESDKSDSQNGDSPDDGETNDPGDDGGQEEATGGSPNDPDDMESDDMESDDSPASGDPGDGQSNQPNDASNEDQGDAGESGSQPDASDESSDPQEGAQNGGGQNGGDQDAQSKPGAGQGGQESNANSGENQGGPADTQNGMGDQTGDQTGDQDNSASTQQGSTGQQSDPAADQSGGQRDETLTDGQRAPLDPNASAGEQFERLKEITDSDDQEGAQKSGEPSDSEPTGNASTKPDSEQEGQPGEGQPGEGQPGEGQPGEGQPGEGQPGEGQPGEGQPGEGQPGEGQPGKSSSGTGGSGTLPTELLEEQKTNLEHAKKSTDLILKKLSEQKFDPDSKLLEEMNWTEDDLNQFLKRWEEMKQKAQSGDPKDVAKYERALKSLGMKPERGRHSEEQNQDEVSGLSTDNDVIQAPANLAPDFNATLRDINRQE